jgi:hypothetical protein
VLASIFAADVDGNGCLTATEFARWASHTQEQATRGAPAAGGGAAGAGAGAGHKAKHIELPKRVLDAVHHLVAPDGGKAAAVLDRAIARTVQNKTRHGFRPDGGIPLHGPWVAL